MKYALFVLISVFTGSFASAHNYYFGFAEMQYNETNQTLETTIVLSAHDLEEIMIKNKNISKSLEYLHTDPAAIKAVSDEILKGFEVILNHKKIVFESLGFEVTRNGLINVYLLAKNVTLGKELDITFSCLMNYFPEQQNKITFILNSKKQTAVFLPHKKSAVITIEE